jgi:hypothetical protein
MQNKGNDATGRATKAAPKTLSAAAVKKMEAAGQKVWRLRDGTAYASRTERRAARAARAHQQKEEA